MRKTVEISLASSSTKSGEAALTIIHCRGSEVCPGEHCSFRLLMSSDGQVHRIWTRCFCCVLGVHGSTSCETGTSSKCDVDDMHDAHYHVQTIQEMKVLETMASQLLLRLIAQDGPDHIQIKASEQETVNHSDH